MPTKDNNLVRYIAIEGGIGVGKTTLATRLSQDLSANLLLEPNHNAYFLPDFYNNIPKNAFTTQIQFLLYRLEQFKEAIQDNTFAKTVISDYCWDKEQLFAKHNLNTEEYRLYQQLVHHLNITIPQPDLVVYLQAPIEVLQSRITKRAIDYEQKIDKAYLLGLCQTYIQYFHKYDKSALLIVNTQNINLVDNDNDYQTLKQHIKKTTIGRHFLNFQSNQ